MAKRSFIRWTTAQRQKLSREVASYNRAITRLERMYGDSVQLPARKSVEDLKTQIVTRQDLARVVNSLGRIHKSKKKDAWDLVDGTIKYVHREAAIAKSTENRVRTLLRNKVSVAKFGKPFKDLTKKQQTFVTAGTDLGSIKGSYKTPAELSDLEKLRYAVSDYNYAHNIIDYIKSEMVWSDVRAGIIYNIEFLRQFPDCLRYIFSLQLDETRLDYYYEYSNDPLPFNERKRNIARFWSEEAFELCEEAGLIEPGTRGVQGV